MSSSNRLVQVVALETYRVDLFLPVSEANELTVGRSINLLMRNVRLRRVGKVIFRSPLIEAATATTRVVLEIDNHN